MTLPSSRPRRFRNVALAMSVALVFSVAGAATVATAANDSVTPISALIDAVNESRLDAVDETLCAVPEDGLFHPLLPFLGPVLAGSAGLGLVSGLQLGGPDDQDFEIIRNMILDPTFEVRDETDTAAIVDVTATLETGVNIEGIRAFIKSTMGASGQDVSDAMIDVMLASMPADTTSSPIMGSFEVERRDGASDGPWCIRKLQGAPDLTELIEELVPSATSGPGDIVSEDLVAIEEESSDE